MMMAGRDDENNIRRIAVGDAPDPPPPPSELLSPHRYRPDSGYNTASPATTISPAPINTPRRPQQFLFDEVVTDTASASRLRVSPEIFRPEASPRAVSPGLTWSDSQVTQFHMEGSDEEEEEVPARPRGGADFFGFQMPNLSNESDEKNDGDDEDKDDNGEEEGLFYTRGNILSHWGVTSEPQTPRYRSGSLSLRTRRYCTFDADDGDDDPNSPGLATATPISRRAGHDVSGRHAVFSRGRAVRSHSFSSAFRCHGFPEDLDPTERRRREELSCRSPGALAPPPLRRPVASTSPLATEPGPRVHATRGPYSPRSGFGDQVFVSPLEDSVFSFDAEDINAYHGRRGELSPSPSRSPAYSHRLMERPDLSPTRSFGFDHERQHNNASPAHSPAPNIGRRGRPVGSAPVLIDRPPQSPASRARRRRVGVVSLSTHVRLSCGQLLPCAASISPASGQERTVSTQTPHATCNIIQQLMSTPAPLPSRARGTAADRLRHYSDGSPAWPGITPPLPDIVPHTVGLGRDRSASAPDLHARAVGREAGRELRRLSDEFFSTLRQRRSLSPVHEDRGGHPASFPRMRTDYFRHVASHFGAFLSEAFGRRRGSSVDLDLDDPDI